MSNKATKVVLEGHEDGMLMFPGTLRALTSALCFALLIAVPVLGHHGAGDDDWAIWDAKQTFEVCGIVAQAEWVNPHARLHVRFTISDGTPATWIFTTRAPNALVRMGFTRQRFLELFAAGTQVRVEAIPKVDGANQSAARSIVRTDGQSLTDRYFDSRMNLSSPRPPMRCLTPADTAMNKRPPEISMASWRQSHQR